MARKLAARQEVFPIRGAFKISRETRTQQPVVLVEITDVDIVGRAEAPRDVEIGGTVRSVIPVIAKLEPLHGFGRKSQERMTESEGKFLFSNDARFIPLDRKSTRLNSSHT